ncbi:HEAT repeat domain-containing protein [Synechococcus sp. MU1617]|uniref:HEAT repeat domain-containing protein n=1 Tax=Synechococcus sp. MU1617 TaxID=2508346 RepID=UPI001CF81706|nr:HEAT repeat domain-containing protein [Synechococcus sp. MU1617]MCB4390351.1 HEAT repeat domain-containing protein [Synechococcus sp. MU1617]
MTGAFDNIHPGLSQGDAIRLLSAPLAELESQSDPYMAAAHLINFPGRETETALIALVMDADQAQPRKLARRKAVEVLGRLGCQEAMAAIANCLNSDDPYLVENAAFALQQLNCQDAAVHQSLRQLLSDPAQNRRVLIQSLAALNVSEAEPLIASFQTSDQPGVRGAAISASIRLGGSRDQLSVLGEQTLLPNQMDRQSAIQDAINAGATELLPQILRAPVSPVFRMRALRALWPDGQRESDGLELLEVLDALIVDRPEALELVHAYDQPPSADFLIQEFFGTDFSRSYLALQTLQDHAAEQLWPRLEQRWHAEAHNDYGAHYFFIRLFSRTGPWPDKALGMIEAILAEAITTRRPQFMKSKPAAVLAMDGLKLVKDPGTTVASWLDPQVTPFWEARYAAAMVASPAQLASAFDDPEPFVAMRARAACNAAAG